MSELRVCPGADLTTDLFEVECVGSVAPSVPWKKSFRSFNGL